MHPCPSCGRPLARASAGGVEHWACGACGGRAFTLGRLSKAFPGPFAERVLEAVDGGGWRGHRRCPICAVHLLQARIAHRGATWALDVCDGCRLAWFDRGEHEAAGGIGLPPPPDPMVDARPSIRLRVPPRGEGTLADPEEGSFDGPLLASLILGVPVPSGGAVLSRPWAFALLSAVIAVGGLLGLLFGPESLADALGLIPSRPFRHGGLDFVTSFFLHVDGFHLLGNLAVLLLFGASVEEVLRPVRFLLLVALSALAGDLLFVAVKHGSAVPSVGASGGISGLLVYWFLAFPRARVRLAWLVWWKPVALGVSSRAALGCWLALQLWLAMAQVEGWGDVNALAHLGGGAVGWAFWRAWPD